MSIFQSNPKNLAVFLSKFEEFAFLKNYSPVPCANLCEWSLLLTDTSLKSSETAKFQPVGKLRSTLAVTSRWLHFDLVLSLLASQPLHVWDGDVYCSTCFCQKMYRALYDKF